MSVITKVQAGANAGTTTVALSWPNTTTTAGNLLIAAARTNSNFATLSTPSGWTQVVATTINTSSRSGYIFAKFSASGGSGDNTTFTASAGAVYINYYEFSCDIKGIWDVPSSTGSGKDYTMLGANNSSPITAPSLSSGITNPSLFFVAGITYVSNNLGAISLTNMPPNGDTTNPTSPISTNYYNGVNTGWGYTTAPASYTPTYTDNATNNKEIISYVVNFSSGNFFPLL